MTTHDKKFLGDAEERACASWEIQNRQEAIQELTEYIDNRQRRQAKVGYLSAAAYERQFHKGLTAA